jgi:hypothetical protein
MCMFCGIAADRRWRVSAAKENEARKPALPNDYLPLADGSFDTSRSETESPSSW